MATRLVIVRDFEGEPLVRRLCGANSKKVFVCIDEETPRPPIGFPREDVFEYDVRALQDLRIKYKTDPSAWKHVKLWRENPSR